MKSRVRVRGGSLLPCGGSGACVVLFIAVAACTPETLTVAETDLVVTVEAENVDYSRVSTYALSEEVQDLCELDLIDGDRVGLGGASGEGGLGLGGGRLDLDLDSSCDPLPGRFDSTILDAIERNMDALGYERVAPTDDPDVLLLAGTVVSQKWYYVPAYYWCDPYYWYACWYPSTGYLYSFDRGAVLINMVKRNQDDPALLDSTWFAGLSGLYEASSEATGPQRIDALVDRAFEQSPYLAEGGRQ